MENMNKSFTKLKNCPVCNSIDIQLFFEQKRNKRIDWQSSKRGIDPNSTLTLLEKQ